MMEFPDISDPAAISRFIRSSTVVGHARLTPEIPLHLATETTSIWRMTADELEASGLPPPFWAFAWAGGQALARHLLNHPELVQGKRVLSVAAGSGLEAIAAARSGACRVWANDIDPVACMAARLNGDLSGVSLEILERDLTAADDAPPVDLILAGDVCYDSPMAQGMMDWLRGQKNRGVDVLLGDPGRSYLPKHGLEKIAVYRAETTGKLEDSDIRNAAVWRLVQD